MIAALLVTALMVGTASQDAAAPAIAEDDVVVIARRLRRMRLSVRLDGKGGLTCRVKRSSGHPPTDALACAATLECTGQSALSKRETQVCVRRRLAERLGLPLDRITF